MRSETCRTTPLPTPPPQGGREPSRASGEIERSNIFAAQKLTLATIPAEDPAVYRMLCRADSLGVFQVESRAQMSMLPRLRPDTFYDLVIEVAIVRPGPIQGDMVHPYLRRRQGIEKVSYPSKALEAVLGKTLGVPLFQEQAMKIAIVAGGFTPWRSRPVAPRHGDLQAHRHHRHLQDQDDRGHGRATAIRAISPNAASSRSRASANTAFRKATRRASRCWSMPRPGSNAAIRTRSPAALLNAQPMGFYAPAQIVRDVREHGVEVRPVDINHSDWDATLEPGPRAATACTTCTAK